MKKTIIFILIIAIFVINTSAFGRPKKSKCKKPIYFFENVKKDILFDELDKTIQSEEYELEKMYPELGYISIKYFIKKEAKPVGLLIKQFGNDAYLFIDISKNATSLEKNVYNNLKKYSKNSYLMNDDMLCRQLSQDAASIHARKKTTIQETPYNSDIYIINMKRYVGYDKKTYKWEKFKDACKNKFKRKNKTKNKIKNKI